MTTNSTEWGIFNDEGCIEASMWSEKEAQAELAKYYIDGEVGLVVATICPEHEEQQADICEECNAECQECDQCGDQVLALSSRGWCDGCEEEND